MFQSMRPPLKTSDLRLIGRAVRNGWAVPVESRPALLRAVAKAAGASGQPGRYRKLARETLQMAQQAWLTR